MNASQADGLPRILEAIDFEKGGGLVTVVAQEFDTGEILMIAYADREALEKTLATGLAHYYSRSRKKLWKKGESSGNVQQIVEVRVDCDADALLYRVRQTGPACHTGAHSCFFRSMEDFSRDPSRY
jgi:phosphoribosyl-AMP cyclohydrolase